MTLSHRLMLVAIALMVAIAPTAHEVCQVSCAPASHASAKAAAPSGHEHCAQAQQSDGASTHLSAASVSDCRSQDNDAAVTASLIKSIGKSPMIATARIADTLVTVRLAPPASPVFLTSVPAPSRTQLRV